MNFRAITDKGIVRRQNQDAYYAFCDEPAELALLLVCDGMGGANAGNVASKIAAQVFSEETKKCVYAGIRAEAAADAMRLAVDRANSAVFEKSNSDPLYSGMGTTMVGAVVTGKEVSVVNVGDSRAYLISGGAIRQLTRDHSVVEDMIEQGNITREESRHHPNKNLITRAVGTAPDVPCDTFIFDIKEGDRLLLCSDGLTNMLADDEILNESLSAESIDGCCEKLLNMALTRGAPDNITIVLLERRRRSYNGRHLYRAVS